MTALPAGTVGAAYSTSLSTTDHRPGTWTVSDGTLPAGLTLTGATIAGTPTTADGWGGFTVALTDVAGATTTATFSLNIRASPIIATGGELATGMVGEHYGVVLATSDRRPGTWTVSDGTLPAGLTVDWSDLSGTPTIAGTFSFTLNFTDTAGATATVAATITIKPFASILPGAPALAVNWATAVPPTAPRRSRCRGSPGSPPSPAVAPPATR